MSMRERIDRIGPYAALVLVLVPLLVVEPLKLIALLIAGEGHWIGGLACLLLAYAGSLFIVERLFRLLRPNMMRSPVLARGLVWLRRIKSGVVQIFRR
jgi:hypothetical protein